MRCWTRFAAATAILLACTAPGVAQESKTFLTKVIQGDLAEVKLGELANQKSRNAEIRAFAQTLMTEHAANKALATRVAEEEGVTPPQSPSEKQKQAYDKLAGLSGGEFDKEFVNYMVEDHKKTIKAFQAIVDEPKNHNLAQYAKESVPVLEKHLQIAEKLQDSMNGTSQGRP